MDYVAAPEIIEKLWNASSGAPNTGTRWGSAASLIQRIASTGWASLPDVEDLLYEMDQTVGDLFHRRLEDLAQVFRLHFRAVFDRPKATTGMIGGTTSILAADCAQLLICLEAAGLNVDPEPLVNSLLSSVSRQQRVTNSDVSVIRYAKERHRCAPLYVTTAVLPLKLSACEQHASFTGYKCDLWRDDSGSAAQIAISSPKFKRARAA